MKNVRIISHRGAFHAAVRQLVLFAVVAELSILVAMVVDSLPVTADSNPYRLFFGSARCLKYTQPLLGVSVGIYHAFIFKRLFEKLGIFVIDTASVIIATLAAVSMTTRLVLSISFNSFWSSPLHMLGGMRAWQVLTLVGLACLIPGGIWALSLLIEFAITFFRRKRNHGGVSAETNAGATVSLKHRFASPMAASRVKARVNSAVADIGETAESNISWISDDTVQISVSSSDVSGEKLAIALASAMA
ncbi:MAG: hypothetical protein IKE20_06155, partial [Eggerthellaceae bacterium]|nr:hypothetical protein [Eggerthellaceae bacterium]